MTTETTYMTVKIKSQTWDETSQIYLGKITWSNAIRIAKQQDNEVRLCHSLGYNNQGHYISVR